MMRNFLHRRRSQSRHGFWQERGENLVEFALVLPWFFLLMFAMIDLGRWYFIKETLQNAVRQAGRYAVTGGNNGLTNRLASIEQVADKAAVGITPLIYQITSKQVGSTNVNGSAGSAGDLITVSLTTTVGFFTPGIARYFGATGSNTFTVSATFRNERFPTGS